MRGKSFLSWLYSANLFVIPLDSTHEFFRFHHLFQQFLQRRLRERYPANEIAALHRLASGWFEAHGFFEEALDQALTAGDVDGAADLVARRRHTLYNQEQFARLTRWLRLLPPDVKEHNAELLLAEARIATLNWRFTEAVVLLEHAKQALELWPPEHPRMDSALGELAVLRSILEVRAGDGERLQASVLMALKMLPLDASHLRGVAHLGMASSKYLLGDAEEARAYLDTELANTSPQLPHFAWLLEAQGFLLWLIGDLTDLSGVSEPPARCEPGASTSLSKKQLPTGCSAPSTMLATSWRRPSITWPWRLPLASPCGCYGGVRLPGCWP